MNAPRVAYLLTAAVVLMTTGCSNSGYGAFGIPSPTGGPGPGGGGPTFVTSSVSDAIGDATTPAAGATAWDATGVGVSRPTSGASTLIVNVAFVQAVSAADLPPTGSRLTSSTQLGVGLLINKNLSGVAVTPPPGSCTGNPTFSNVVFSVDPGVLTPRLADGNFAVLNQTGAQVGEASASFSLPNTLTYSIPMAAIGGLTGPFNLAVIVGNGAGSTDCAPDTSFFAI